MSKPKPKTSSERKAKFTKEQALLGRKPKTLYLTNEENILANDFIKNMRGEITGGMEPIAVRYSESTSVRELLRIMRIADKNPSITNVDLSLVYKLHSKDFSGYPVVSVRVSGEKIKGLNYDN